MLAERSWLWLAPCTCPLAGSMRQPLLRRKLLVMSWLFVQVAGCHEAEVGSTDTGESPVRQFPHALQKCQRRLLCSSLLDETYVPSVARPEYDKWRALMLEAPHDAVFLVKRQMGS